MNDFSSIVKNKFVSAINGYSMLDGATRIVVGFSGGADSVCLLHLLKSFEGTYSYTVIAAHLNHGIRGDEAMRDQTFCKDFCKEYNVPFYIKEIDCISLAKERNETVEECGRAERYGFFSSLCENEGFKIATAHNSNDNAETVLFNLCRGTALKGVSGIPPVRDNIIRPVLFCSREEIEGYCRENGLEYVTDSTNLSYEYTRNNIRHNVLPALKSVNSAYLQKITEFSLYAADISSYLKESAFKCLSEARLSDGVYDSDQLLSLDTALCRECIVVAFSQFSDTSLDRQKIHSIYNLLSQKGRVQIYGNIYAEVLKNKFRFFRLEDDNKQDRVDITDLSRPFRITYNGYELEISEYTDYSKKINKKILDNLIDYDKIKGNIFLGTRSEGDRFTFYDRKVSKTLKKLFNETGVPLEERDRLPVLYDDEGVIWIFGVGTNARCRVNDNATNIIFVTGENEYES